MGLKKIMAGRIFAAGVTASLLASAAVIGVGSQAVYANSSEDGDSKKVVKEEKLDGTPFSVPGNAELLDDVTDDDSKQFITVRTKNNQTFFVVIDRQNSADNVYMLSMIDEDDLSDFLEDGKNNKLINIPEKEKTEETAAKDTGEEKTGDKAGKKSEGSSGGLLVAIGIILMIVGGYYFLKIRPKKKYGSGRSDEDDKDEYDEDEYEEEEDYEGEDGYEEGEDYEGEDRYEEGDADEYEAEGEEDEE